MIRSYYILRRSTRVKAGFNGSLQILPSFGFDGIFFFIISGSGWHRRSSFLQFSSFQATSNQLGCFSLFSDTLTDHANNFLVAILPLFFSFELFNDDGTEGQIDRQMSSTHMHLFVCLFHF